MIYLSDALNVSERRTTADGYMVANAKAARQGVQIYAGAEVKRPDLAVVRIFRPESEVFSHDSRASYAHKPITIGHPPQGVSAATWRQHAVGHVGDEVARDGDFIRVPLMLADAAAVAQVMAGTRELSAGYNCELDWTSGRTPTGDAYDAVQRTIRINHVALVAKGRAGANCRIGDSAGPLNPLGHALKDRPMQINDAIQALPHGLHSKIHYALSDMAGTDRMVVEQGLSNMASVMHHLRGNGPQSGLVADADQTALGYVIGHIEGQMDAARTRLRSL